jgi:hypothetical protein
MYNWIERLQDFQTDLTMGLTGLVSPASKHRGFVHTHTFCTVVFTRAATSGELTNDIQERYQEGKLSIIPITNLVLTLPSQSARGVRR